MSAVLSLCRAIFSWLLIFGVRCYQVTLGPLMSGQCRFQPTCSNYFILAVKKHGPLRGAIMGLGRICRCHPWGKSGEDWP